MGKWVQEDSFKSCSPIPALWSLHKLLESLAEKGETTIPTLWGLQKLSEKTYNALVLTNAVSPFPPSFHYSARQPPSQSLTTNPRTQGSFQAPAAFSMVKTLIIVVAFTFPVSTLAQALGSVLYLHDIIKSLQLFQTLSSISLDEITETQEFRTLTKSLQLIMTELRLNSKPRAVHLTNLWLPQACCPRLGVEGQGVRAKALLFSVPRSHGPMRKGHWVH